MRIRLKGGLSAWVFVLSGPAGLFGAAGFGIAGMPAEMFIWVVAAATVMLFGNLDKIAKFKATPTGFEVETLRRKLDETAATVEQLKDVVATLSRPLLWSVTNQGRWFNAARSWEAFEAINADLQRLELSASQIEQATEEFLSTIACDHCQHVVSAVQLTPEQRDQVHKLRRPWPELWIAPPSEFRKLFDGFGMMQNPQVSAAIADYEYFAEHRRLRRPEMFLRAGK